MNAAAQTMMDAWPELSPTTVWLVTSLPSLISLPVTIGIGTVSSGCHSAVDYDILFERAKEAS